MTAHPLTRRTVLAQSALTDVPAPGESALTDIPEIELAVFDGGNPDGPTIVMVHGWPDSHHLWNGVVDQLVQDFHVVTYDTRGHGESTSLPEVAQFSIAAMAADLFAVIDAVSPDAPVHVLAHDWGSVQAWEAVCEPNATERIASFISISGPNLDHLALWVRERLQHPTPRNLLGVGAQAASSLYTLWFMSVLGSAFFKRVGSASRWSRFLRVVDRLEPAPSHHGPTLKQDMVNGLSIYKANIVQMMRNPRERFTEVPVLQIVPTRDIAIRGASYEETPKWASNVGRVDVPFGHWLPLTQPALVAEETVAFIRSLEPTVPPVASTPLHVVESLPRPEQDPQAEPAAH